MDPNEGKHVSMNIDITFPNAPCFSKYISILNGLIVIDIESRSTVSVLSKDEVNRDLFRRRVSKTGEILNELTPNFNDQAGVAQLLKESLDNEETCNIKGKIRLNRVK